MIARTRPVLLGLGLTAALAVTSARAAAQSQNAVIAESLYQEAQKLLAAGQTEQACEKFAGSHRLDPAPGTVLNLAACHEKLGRFASAWTEYQEAQALAARRGDKRREEYASQKIAALEKNLHRVVIEILTPIPGMEVKLDGNTLVREAWGTGIALDPGDHAVVVTAPGYKTWTRKLTLGPGAGIDRIEVPHLEAETEKPAEGPATPPPTTAQPAPEKPAPAPEPSKPMSAQDKRTIGLVVGGAGVVSLGVAVFFAARTASLTSDRDGFCPSGAPCFDQRAFDADHDARVAQQWMLVTGGVGLALAGAGAWLFFTAKDPAEPAKVGASPTARRAWAVVPGLTAKGGGVDVVGRF